MQDFITRRVWAAGIVSMIALGAAAPALAQTAPAPTEAGALDPADAAVVGVYGHSEMELVSGIRLKADGTFDYGLTVGSLDETAKGRWGRKGNRIELTSDPRPVAPTVTAGRIIAAPGQPFAFRVLGPRGDDVPGVDFEVEFDSGEPLQSYSNGDVWTVPEGETRAPRFVTFSMPSYRLHSERLPLDPKAGTVATFDLKPNDFGVADFTGVFAEVSGDTLQLYRPEGVMTFRRQTKD